MTAQPIDPAPEPLHLNTLVRINPADAVIGTNVRLDPRLDKQFLASIRERGVLVPVVGHLDEQGRFVVLYGQRRTLAAVETGREEVPAYIVESQGDADRLIDQMAENDHRASITSSERIAGFEQLAALGLSAAQIAKRTATKRADVDTALVVASNELATKAVERWDWLTLDQAAGLAEFSDDAEAVKRLTVAAQQGRFEHTLQRERDNREERRLIDEFKAALTAKGVTVIDRPGWDDKTHLRLEQVRTDGKAVTVEEHASCPGHAAWVSVGVETIYDEADDDEEYDEDEEEDGPEPERRQVARAHFCCLDWRKHGHTDGWSSSTSKPKAADMTDAEREKAAAERRDVIDSNKAWKSAEVVRRQWLTTFLTRKTPPKGTGQFIAAALLDRYTDRLTHMNTAPLRDKLLGGSVDTLDGVSEPRALVVSLGHVLAAFEGGTGTHTWRNPSPAVTRYLRFLQANGYTLSDVEERACLPVE
jgi:ParB family chromosome partitioning protein